ncbi:YihY/virulence factor BrkB family protein [uncultured Jatrophihabitans sp.]|uniref:YihY/virulence factor BrkB family protein n=1 Tax=uncultured Jatrophihabitans sp. TaxID=1610747 RepID=UPI0035C960C9
MSHVQRLDAFQRRHPKLGLPLAVLYKFFDDQGGYLAALITYYGFLSLFPLLLLLSTILNFALSGNPHLQQDVLKSALGQFPIVGNQLSDPHGVSGSGVALAVGIIGTIYGGLGVANAAQNAMNVVWRVPRNSRPNPLKARLRSIQLLLVVGLSVLGTTVLSALGTSAGAFGAGNLGTGIKVLFVALSMAVNAAVFTLGFRVATARDLTLRQTVPGAIAAAVAWQVLQSFGATYVGSVVKHAKVTNSVFALVLGLIGWIYLEAMVVVFAVEYNAVRALKLWPRALLTPFTDNVELTAADEASYTAQARSQRSKGFEQISVTFDHSPDPGDDAIDATGVEPADGPTAASTRSPDVDP